MYILSFYLLHFCSFPPLFSIHLHPLPSFLRFRSIPFFLSHCIASHPTPPPPPTRLIFVLYLCRLISVLFLQLNVVRGSGRFIPTPPYPSYLYGRILKRDQVRCKPIERDSKLEQSNENYSTKPFCVSRLESCCCRFFFFCFVFHFSPVFLFISRIRYM